MDDWGGTIGCRSTKGWTYDSLLQNEDYENF